MPWNQNICRICGEISNTCHLIYNKDSNDQDLEAKIKKCLKLELFKDDNKPKQICTVCLLKLDDFHQFLTICHAADQKFESILLGRQQWSNDGILDYTQQKMTVIVNPKVTIDTLDCNEIDLYKESVLQLDNCAINDQDMLEIVENATYTNLPENLDYLNSPGYGIKKFQSDFYQENTVLRHSSNYNENQENSCSSNAVINYSCQNLDKDLSTPNIYNKQNSTEIYHKSAESTFSNIAPSYTAPVAPVATPIEPVGLDYSSYNSRTIVTFSTPVNPPQVKPVHTRKKEIKFFDCPHCGRKFKRRVTLNGHIAIHTKIRPFICDICKKTYATKSDLTNHQKVHTDRNQCKYCKSCFSAPSKLKRHLPTHTKDKPFTCDFKDCNKSFADKRNLDGHKLLHTNEFKFNCDQCEKVFKTKNRLKQHGKAHTSTTPYVCEVCSKCYKYKSNLVIHLKKHNGYFCPHCNKDCQGIIKLIKHKKVCPAREANK